MRCSTPLAIATSGVNFASHVFAYPAVAQIAFALGGVSSVAGLVTGLEKRDLGRILIDSGAVARTTLTIYSNSLSQQKISEYGSVFRAGELIGNGNVLAAELHDSRLGVDQMFKGLGRAVAMLNIINSLANGDIKGRLALVNFKRYVMFLRYFDTLTGQECVRSFDFRRKHLSCSLKEDTLCVAQTSQARQSNAGRAQRWSRVGAKHRHGHWGGSLPGQAHRAGIFAVACDEGALAHRQRPDAKQ